MARLVFLFVPLILLVCSSSCLHFEAGYDHHYTYSSQSDILGLHNITTVIKVALGRTLQPLVPLLLLVCSSSCLHFEAGYDYHYTYSSQSDILGLHNITTVIKFRVRPVNHTSGGTLNQLMVDSFVQHSEKGYVADNPMKWNLDQVFYFTVGEEGLVSLVHYHPEEIDELLSLKKVLASTMSARVRIANDSSWSFQSTETDHTGTFEHNYEGKRHSDGFRLSRTHRSTDRVHRSHDKTLYLDVKGTPLHIESVDNITLHDKPSTVSKKSQEGFAEIQETETGEFPKISSVSRTRMKLTVKSKHGDTSGHNTNSLKQDSLIVRERAKEKLVLRQQEARIQELLQCIHSHIDKYDTNRTECVHNLRELVFNLQLTDFHDLVRAALLRDCNGSDVNTTLCVDERNLYLDLVAVEGSPTSQELFLNLVMKQPNVTEDDLRRCLFHCIALAHPIKDLVKYVEDLCFGQDAYPGDTPSLHQSRKRACLSLGAMAKSLHDKNVTESDRIAERLEDWLQHHDQETTSKVVKLRARRSINKYDSKARKHVETKMILLQSLGNAGKQRSIHHIKSYMEPNVGVSAWRRAAIHSLRHFKCNDSAAALLTSAVHDDNEVVRTTAKRVLQRHPQSINLTEEHENIVLSKNYTYPVVARVRRGLMQALEEGIRVYIKPPGIEWDKMLGNSKIGASFGLHIRNILDLKIGLLDGHFVIDVYDGAYAEAHVGLLNFQVDIVKAYICFNGHIKYDLNILKDFGINSLSDIVHIYDKILDKIVNPIKEAIMNFHKLVNLFKNGGLQKIVNILVTTVKNLPTILGDVANRLAQFVKKVFSIAGNTIIKEIQIIVKHIQDFVDGVKQDILKFYNDIVDAVTMAMPFITKKIKEAFGLIIEAFNQIIKNPMQAISAMSRAITDIKMSVTMIIDTKNKVVDACLFIKGRAVEWMNTAKEIPSILRRLHAALDKLVKSSVTKRDIVDEMTGAMSDGIDETKSSLVDLKRDLKAEWNKVLEPLQPLLNITKPFVDTFKSVMDVIKGVKWAYREIKDVVQTSKMLVQKVFGPKFYKDFPTERRPKRDGCKEGVYPSTDDNAYETTGVDLSLGVGQSIKNPVNGIVNDKGGNKVVIKPVDPEFEGLEVVIENINVLPNVNGKNLPAGEKIGRASRAKKRCKPNSIHLSMRKMKQSAESDADYDYIDPSTYLDRLVPIPKWIQECNDYEFRYIGQTSDSGEADDGEPDEEKEDIKRDNEDVNSMMDDHFGEEDTTYRPDDPSLYDDKPVKDQLMQQMKDQAKQFADFFKTALFGEEPKVPDILHIVDLNGKSVEWITDQLTGHLKDQFKKVVGDLKSKITAMPIGNPATFSQPHVMNLLKMNGVKAKVGDVAHMTDALMNMAGKVCPTFKGAIAKGLGHVCTVHDDCMGIVCSVPIKVKAKEEHIKISVTAIPNDRKILLQINDKPFQIVANGVDVELNTKISILGMRLYIVANAEVRKGILSLSVETKVCTKIFHTCLPSIEILHEIQFTRAPSHVRKRRATMMEAVETGLQLANIPSFIGQLGDNQLLTKDITHILESVRQTVVDGLLKSAVSKLGNIVSEMTQKLDFCLSANIPVPPFDVQFFSLRNYFMVGPVPLSLGQSDFVTTTFTPNSSALYVQTIFSEDLPIFWTVSRFGAGGSVGMGVRLGLCVLSMTTQVTLTPWVGGKVWGDAAVDIGFARGGIRLIGLIMQTKFPLTTELVFSKYPIDVGSRMDMELRPLTLELLAFAELNLLFTTVTVFEGRLWHYAVPMIKKNIFNKKKRDEDKSPPNILPATMNARRKREGPKGCIVMQIPGRPYYDTAFSLEMYAQDEVSETKLFYAIGTHRGGTNLVDWTEMGGSSLLVPIKLPGGIPIYWTVKARNSQGQEAVTQCDLNTFDNTLPDGRVEHSYKFSSHPSKLVASVVAFEDSPLVETHYKAVGFSPGQFGSQFVGWEPLRLDHTIERSGVSGSLKQFTIPREGKLVAWVLQTQKLRTPDECAQKCIDYGFNCVSFDYEHHSETCDFHDVVQGANAYLRISGTYSNYERLGSGYHTPIEYSDLDLKHGSTYFVNTRVSNVLGYDAYLIGEGTMIDFTPPEPGLINNGGKDYLRADGCKAAITQRCIDVTRQNNHRILEDGPGSGTIFNGHEPLYDELYTLTNHYVSANWKGFHDDESGIWGHTWAVGRNVCGTDIVAYEDPYSHLSSKKFWTDSAFHKGIHLEDGQYYVTVQALNGVELGGSLVTTVCHTTPFTVDTTPPVFNKVTDIIYDEDFDLIAIYYEAKDDLSKIAHAEFGLGKTKYDVQLKPYGLHAPMEREDPFVSTKDLGLQEGIPAWIRIRVTNNVDLFTAGHGDEPILIDRSMPLPGNVLDGDRLRQDRMYQADDDKICAQWVDFYDPESGIDRFMWGAGTKPRLFDIVPLRNLTRYEKSACSLAKLQHNHTYYSTVFAYNNALNSKAVNASSNGVLVDITKPIAGQVFDGQKDKDEQQYSSETVSKFANWKGYSDPESHIAAYKVDVFVNNEHKKTFDVGTETEFEDHTISMEHLDEVYYTVHGINGADLENPADSNGFLVDLTPPIMTEISDNKAGRAYQSSNDKMELTWHFKDDDSGIIEYRTIIYETKYGVKQKFWPETDHYNTSKPTMSTKMSVELGRLTLQDGAKYSLHVTALNGAQLATSHESTGVTVDTSPPNMPKVHIGLPKDDEELNEDNNVLHDDQTAIRVSWSGRDSESGIEHFLVAIGTANDTESVLAFRDYGEDTTAYIQNIHFETSNKSGMLYVVSVKAINGAGLESLIGKSKPIFIQKADVPGIVFDGRDRYTDASYTVDHTSVAATFYGFESEACNIVQYEWAIGTVEYGTDVLSYTDYGLVMLNDTHGQCQIHTELYEDTTYYVTVRATTACRDRFILSSSDGVTVDRNPPVITYEVEIDNDTSTVIHDQVFYHDTVDNLPLSSNVSDTNSVASTTWALGTLPLLDDLHSFSDDLTSVSKYVSVNNFQPGEAVFLTTNSSDKAGNVNTTSSMAIIVDTTAPLIKHLACTKYLSTRRSLLKCDWETVSEVESLFEEIRISIGTTLNKTLILEDYPVPKSRKEFVRDIHSRLHLLGNVTELIVGFEVTNILGQKTQYGKEVIYDTTGPVVDRLDVVTSTTDDHVSFHLKCQLPMAYVEVMLQGAEDIESQLDNNRFEISIGTKPYGMDVLRYKSVSRKDDGTFFIDGFTMISGTTFYASMRIYNQAGLYTDISSERVVVSQAPRLSVIDGDKDDDIDFQSVPNIVQGRWKYSDSCPIREAYWSLHDLSGNVLVGYQAIPSAAFRFYNDEILLENGKKYIVFVKTVDFLNRTKIARSDGFTVRIQPPLPGHIRDGEAEDINYQFSTNELSANWDSFGDRSDDPTQLIDHYEIAIGNDRRYEKTRSNVHFFVDVGLNKSYTFKNLNLTAKLVRYYITVRAYSKAGGYAEGYSNGIRVGFDDAIDQGSISVTSFQSEKETMSVSWTGFRSDIGIIQYKVGISSHIEIISNDTVQCSDLGKNESMYDIRAMKSVGLDEYTKAEGLDLKHNKTYYVTVVAEDEAGMCTAVTSSPILVDLTEPTHGHLLVNNIISETVLFATSDSELHVSWLGYEDPESDIKLQKVTIFECQSCETAKENSCYSVAENVVGNDNKTAFYELQLSKQKTYFVQLEVHNKANLKITDRTSTILIDTSPPLSGSVKITEKWDHSKSFQKYTTEISGLVAIAKTLQDFECPSQKKFFPTVTTNKDDWQILSSEFSDSFYALNRSGAFLGIGYNAEMTEILRSGIMSELISVHSGNYTARLIAAKGQNIITTLALATDGIVMPYAIKDKPSEMQYDISDFDNITGLVGSPSNNSDAENNTESSTVVPTPSPLRTNGSNTTEEDTSTNFETNDYGIGIHFLGYKIDGNHDYHCLFWARNKLTSVERWFRVDFDPTTAAHTYTINLKKKVVDLDSTVDITLIIDDEEIITIGGFNFGSDTRVAFATWNEDDYQPPIDDIYNPFYRTAIVTEVKIPEEVHKPCLDGKGFFDDESGIKDIFVGVSDSEKEIGNVSPMKLYQSFCFPCVASCKELCKEPCSDTVITDGFTLIPIKVNNLTLEPTQIDNACLNLTDTNSCNTSAYYLNVRVVNFAGEESLVHSNGIQIDITPPECDYVKCLDPDYSVDEPTDHIGSSSSIGAYWNCSEDISQINEYRVRVLTNNGRVVMNSTGVGLKTKTNFTLGNGTFQNEKDYILEMTAINLGGLSNTYSCSVHVNLYPPDTSRASSGPMFTDTSTDVNDETPLWTSSQTNVGITWNGGTNDTEFYEWKIGTVEDSSDIFPPVKVGKTRTGSSSIEHGKLKFNRAHTNKTVGEFIDTRNMSAEAVANISANEDREKSFFVMEPGRCMYQSLYAIGYSHLKSKIAGKPVCVKRVGDVYLNASQSKTTNFYKSKRTSEFKIKPDGDKPQVTIHAALQSGGLTVGSISEADKQTDYGSAATFDFNSFISDPKLTGHKTSRLLRKRIMKYCDLAFYMAPASHAEFEHITINITVPSGCDKDTDYQPALIYWDSDDQEWKHIDEGCRDYLTAVDHNGTYTAEVCPGFGKRTKRSTTGSYPGPKHNELVRISRSFPNSAPNIVTNVVTFTEDKYKEFFVETEDAENDTLILTIVKQPEHAECIITSNTTINCTFEDDFYGDDVISVKVKEDGLPKFEEALKHMKDIRLEVSGEPDETERFFIDRFGHLHRSNIPSMKITITENANGTDTIYAGTVVLADVDGNEVFKPIVRFAALGNATYDVKQVTLSEIPNRKQFRISPKYRTVTAFNVYLHISTKLSGNMTLDFIAKTGLGAMTPSVTITAYILENPCVYGRCSHPSGDFACDDIKRAESFEKYFCECRLGYEGDWCQIETDECKDEPCALMFDCEDLINDYNCNINVPKLMAILICSLVAVCGAAFVLYKVVRRFKNKKLSDSTVCLQNQDAAANRKFGYVFNEPETRPVTSQSIHIEPTDVDDKPDTSGLQGLVNPAWQKPDDDVDIHVVSAITAFASNKLPPHHQSYKPNIEPNKTSKPDGKADEMRKHGAKLATFLEGKKAPKTSKAKKPGESKQTTPANYDRQDSLSTTNSSRSAGVSSTDLSPTPDPIVVDEAGSNQTRVTSASSARSMRSESSIVVLTNDNRSMTDIDV